MESKLSRKRFVLVGFRNSLFSRVGIELEFGLRLEVLRLLMLRILHPKGVGVRHQEIQLH